MSLDRYSEQLLVPGSVARNVRDLIRSLAYARLPHQPVVIWNGIDSREIYYCPVRRDAESSGCPARNTTLPNVPPVTSRSNPLPSRSNPLPSRSKPLPSRSNPLPSRSNPLPSRSNPLPSSTTTHSSTSSHGGTFTLTTTISGLGGSSLTKTISDHDTTTVY